MRQYRLVVPVLVLFAVAGCANKKFGACGVAGGLLGATIGATAGGFGTHEYEGGSDTTTAEVAGGAAAGGAAGALIGALLGHLICDPEKEPPPPPRVEAPPPPPPPPPKGTKIATVGEAYFDFDKADLKPSAEEVLREAVRLLRENADMRVVIEGHTDSVGSDTYNQRLSERRAEAVKRYLVRQGIDASRIRTVGNGESRPIADNTTAAGRAKNRRAEIVVD
jgi:OOP family OmpA-OmpF porin